MPRVNPLNWISKLANLTEQTRTVTKTVTEGIAEVRAAIAEKRRELVNAKDAPVPPAELAERIAAWLDARAERGINQYARSIPVTFGRPNETVTRVPYHLAGELDTAVLLALGVSTLKREIPALVARLSYTPGPPSSERPALVERLERELAELEGAEEAAIDAAAEAGVVVQHRPEVLARRASEAERRKRDELAASARAAREAAIAARPGGSGVVGAGSTYLGSAAPINR